jgi:tRNA threonylcarbamoyladenosine biosynthesis protein TsaE
MERTTKYAWETASAGGTARIGESIGRRLRSGLCVSVVGALGAGKTVLVGGICRGLGVEEEVLSPTFVLYEEFDGRLPVVHIDLYRLEHESEIDELGVFDLLGGHKVILAEWGDRSETLLARSDAVIELAHSPGLGGTGRRIEVTCSAAAAGAFAEVEP